MKRPAFQFYPADWRKDAALQSCSVAARGLWIEAMCIAHECEPYGHLVVNGRPMNAAQIGRLVGLSAKECAVLLDELESAGVLSRTEDGAVFSRRMVRDEELRQRRSNGGKEGSGHGEKGAEHGAKGGRPRKEKPPLKTPLGDEVRGVFNPPQPEQTDEGRGVFEPPIKPPPSSSSSSSTSVSIQSEDKHTPLTVGVCVDQSQFLAGVMCRAMRAAGIADTNPGHPSLLTLLAAGATEAELVGAAHKAAGQGKGFAYALGIAVKSRQDAAAIAATLHAGPMPVVETAYQASMRQRVEEFSPGLGRQVDAASAPVTFDFEAVSTPQPPVLARDVPRLGVVK